MTETAAHLVDHVFPPLPVRQWVVSVPESCAGIWSGIRRSSAPYGLSSCGASRCIWAASVTACLCIAVCQRPEATRCLLLWQGAQLAPSAVRAGEPARRSQASAGETAGALGKVSERVPVSGGSWASAGAAAVSRVVTG